MTEKNQPVLEVENLSVSYQTRKREIMAVRDISFSVHQGETFGLVGESGCGKSTVAFSLVNFLGPNGGIRGGKVLFLGHDLSTLPEKELRELRGSKVAMVYQDPTQALNPSMIIGRQLSEVLEAHGSITRREAEERCIDYLKRVRLPDPEVIMNRYPHQISGGQQQRVVIAMALLSNPELLILDEPTTALDVTVEATVLDLVDELQKEFNTASIYITHDFGVVARVCDTVGVMYAGEIVERAPVKDIFLHPIHPYSRGLIRCLPKLDRDKRSSLLQPIRGAVPSPDKVPKGCIFSPRCNYMVDDCKDQHPHFRVLEEGRWVRCHRAEEIHGGEVAQFKDLEPAPLPTLDEMDKTLSIKDLKTYYRQESTSALSLLGLSKHQDVKALDGVSFGVPRGATLGIVGESGCGKSTLAKTVVGLEDSTAGEMDLIGVDINVPVVKRDLEVMKKLQMVFQNPDATLNPSFSIGYQIARPLRRFKVVPPGQVYDEVIKLLQAVRLDTTYYSRLPKQLSGGEKQRVAVARAIAAHPELVICDEPLSALDVSVQAATINLMVDLQREYGITMLFIAHDLSVVRFLSDYVAVMYLGKICELGPSENIYSPPFHPYTEALLSAIPIPDPTVKQRQIRLGGTVPSPLNPPAGCNFHTRCPRLLGDICREEEPPIRKMEDGHRIHCHISLEDLASLDPVIHG